jgi:hypothetical protein
MGTLPFCLRDLRTGRRRPRMRYHLGVDWADAEHAVWGEDDQGMCWSDYFLSSRLRNHHAR